MSEGQTPSPRDLDPEQLRQIVTRLREVRRRHLNGAGESDDFILIQERLEQLISTFEGWLPPFAGTPDLEDGIRRLRALQRQCSGAGLRNVAQVLANVEAALAALRRGPADGTPGPPQRFVPPPTPARATTTTATEDDDEFVPPWERSGREPRPTGRIGGWVALVVILAAAAAVAWVTLRPAPAPAPVAELPPTPTLPPPTPTATPTPVVDALASTLERVDQEIALAERALKAGNAHAAALHFANAAAADRYDRKVKDLFEPLVAALLAAAEELTEVGDWEQAAARVGEARSLAEFFGADTSAIDDTARWHATKAHFSDFPASDQRRLAAAVGHRVRVTRRDRATFAGVLATADTTTLVVEVDAGMGGGQVRFTREIAVAEVATVRLYEDGKPIRREILPTPTPTRPPSRRRPPPPGSRR